jgi:predicted O-linked N-acetylglucosamine transferase (SPINDLY family)
MLGAILHQLDRSDEAIALFDRALAVAPAHAAVLANRAAVELDRGNAERAATDARAALAVDPQRFGARLNLGLALDRLGRTAEASHAFRVASAQRADHAGALLHWLRAAGIANQPAGIVERLSRPLPRIGGEKRLALDAVSALEDAGQTNAAFALLTVLRAESPNDGAIAARIEIAMRYARACALEAQRRSSDALAAADDLLIAEPHHRGAQLLRAELLLERGEVAAALDAYAALIETHPNDAIAASSHLIALQHAPSVDADTIAGAHRDWARRHAGPVAPRPAFHADAGTPLRIGWISPRFSAGVVGTFFAAEFEALDRESIQHVVYDDGSAEDAVNARFRAAADVYRRVDALDDTELAERIREDRVDVLVDLAGHSPGNRLRLFSKRPAPVQAAWLDYFHSTGSDAIDFFISDAEMSPAETAHRYSERLVHLDSGRLCYATDVAPRSLNERAADIIRFGCFNRVAKINDDVLATWSAILAACPGSQLRLKASAFDDAQSLAHFVARAARHDIGADRLELAGYGTHTDVLAAYADVDIALDPFPFSGCATSCDALASGVPVVTLEGAAPAGRQTASLLAAAGRREWIAHGRDDYVRIAVALAADPALRRRWRSELPGLARATFGDVRRHARALSDALRAMRNAVERGETRDRGFVEPLRIGARSA